MKNIKIVTVGGGTGSYTVLMGLKNLKNVSLSALVSMADNGGSTGVLRDELGVLPPGDVRQCLVALSEHSDIVRKLMSYRFSKGGLTGHSFGNLFLAALEKVTGDFVEGVEVAKDILKVRGSVIPVTKENAELCVCLKNGDVVVGQKNIGKTNLKTLGLKKIFYKKSVSLNKKAEEMLLDAGFIIIGPGDYFESLVPNFIVGGFKKAIKKTKAKIVFVVNMTNKKIHTEGWTAFDYMMNTEKYLGRKIDFILMNNEPPSEKQKRRYQLKEGDGVLVLDDLKERKNVIRYPLLSHLFFDHIRSFIRHDSLKLAGCIDKIIKSKKYR